MRSALLLAIVGLLGACYVPPAVSAPDPDAVPDAKTHRPLITDQLPYGLEREKVRSWHSAHNWRMRRTWPQTDEFVEWTNENLNLHTPPMYAMARYDEQGRTIAYATFTPVPCRMSGQCDRVWRTGYASEHELVDHSNGLDPDLADRGRASVENAQIEMKSMQTKTFDALASELRRRFGGTTWQEPHRWGATWMTDTSVVGLFVAGNGGWVVETHEKR